MSCLGVHFALAEDEVKKLKSISDEDERLEYIVEEIEEKYFDDEKKYAAESDKSWDAMHQALSGCGLNWEGGEYPLNHTVLVGELLYTKNDYIMSLKTPKQVVEVNRALKEITENNFRDRYFKIDPKNYDVDLSEEDFEYTWDWLQNVRKLYEHAANEGRYVLFTADQ